MTDGYRYYLTSLSEGLSGAPRHGHPSRWDWGLTARSIEVGQQRHARLQALADGLTPEQRAALWTTSDPRAAVLRRFARCV